jgi:hypothetical protein
MNGKEIAFDIFLKTYQKRLYSELNMPENSVLLKLKYNYSVACGGR